MVDTSPLLPFVELDQGRRRVHRRARPAGRAAVGAPGCSPAPPRSTSPRRRACPRPATRRTPTTASASAPACGPGRSTCGRARRRSPSSPSTCSAARRCCSGSWPGAGRAGRHRRAAPRPLHRRHPHPRRPRPVPGLAVLQPVRLEPPRLRPGLDPVPRRAHHATPSPPPSRPGSRPGPPSAAPRCGPHPQPVDRPPPQQRHRRRRRRRQPPQVRAGQPVAPRGAGRHAPAARSAPSPRSRSTAPGISHHAHEYNARRLGLPRRAGWPTASSGRPASDRSSAPWRRPTPTCALPCAPARPATSRPSASAGASARPGPPCTPGSEADLTDDVRLGAGLREIDLGLGYDAATIDGVALAPPGPRGVRRSPGPRRTCTPVLGWLPPFRPACPSRRRSSRGPHGRKWILGSKWLQPMILPKDDFPSVLP